MKFTAIRRSNSNKYNARKTVHAGQRIDSKREAKRYSELLALERNGLINNLERQVRYELIPKQDRERAAFYTADFKYFDWRTAEWIIEDSKPPYMRKKADYVLRRKLMLKMHGIRIREV